jgi:hypothetical protein
MGMRKIDARKKPAPALPGTASGVHIDMGSEDKNKDDDKFEKY